MALVIVVAMQPAGAHRRLGSVGPGQGWPAYLFSARHPSATTGPATITPGNASSLKAAWVFQEQPPTGTRQPQGGFSASPTVSGGMVFIGSQTVTSMPCASRPVTATNGDPLFTGTHLYHAYSVLRLNAGTLALSGAFQFTLGQATDLDFGSSPTLFNGDVHGSLTLLVGACSKDGLYYAVRRNAVSGGPVWSARVGVPAHIGRGMCLASAVWNPKARELHLAGNATSIGGHSYDGSVREVNPGTGTVRWATGLDCAVVGTPALDAATGVLAVAAWTPCRSGSSAVSHPATVRVIRHDHLAGGAVIGQSSWKGC